MKHLLPTSYFLCTSRRGQSLVEVLLAMVIGVIMIVTAVGVIAPALKTRSGAGHVQVAAALGKELLDTVRSASEADWHMISLLASGSSSHYHLATSTSATSSYMIVAGDEAVTVATTTFIRYFYVDPVSRGSGGEIVASGGSADPSTKKITVYYGWTGVLPSAMATYVTRSKTKILSVTDWSGGSGLSGPVTNAGNRFASSTNVDITTLPGSLTVILN